MIWLGAAALAVVLLYLLRPPARRFSVPSTLLWERLVERTRKRRRWLRWLLSLLLSALFVLLLLATLLRIEPRFGAVTDPVILIDNTGSMGTRLADDPDASRLDRALSLARTLLEQSSGTMTVADLAGTFGPSTFRSLDEATRALDRVRWRPELPARFPAMFLRTDPSRRRPVYLLTDRPDRMPTSSAVSVPGSLPGPTEVGEGWTLIDVSTSAENVGFVTLSTSPPRADVLGAPTDSAFLEILNGGAEPQTARLQVDVLTASDLEGEASTPARLLERDLEIASGATWTGVLDLSRAHALAAEREPSRQLVLRATVRSTLADQQPVDDIAWLVLDEGRIAIDGSRRADVRLWPRWLTRVFETSARVEVATRSESGTIRVLATAPSPTGDREPGPCLVLPTVAEPIDLRLQRATLQVPGQEPLELPWTAVALAEPGPEPTGAAQSTSPWLVAQPAEPGAQPVALVSAPDPVTGCVHWRFDPVAAHLETRPEFPALVESVLLALASQPSTADESGRERLRVWSEDGWSPMDDQVPGSVLIREGPVLRASAPPGPEVTRVLSSPAPAAEAIQRVEPEAVDHRSGSPWPRRTVLIALLALLLVFEAGTRLAGWTE